MLKWKIWFWNWHLGLITLTNLELANGVVNLPILPVAIIINIRRDNNGTRWCMEFGRNFYCLVGDEWWASTYSGLLNYIDFFRPGTILRGGMIPNQIFQEAYDQAKKDPEIQATTVHEFERPEAKDFD